MQQSSCLVEITCRSCLWQNGTTRSLLMVTRTVKRVASACGKTAHSTHTHPCVPRSLPASSTLYVSSPAALPSVQQPRRLHRCSSPSMKQPLVQQLQRLHQTTLTPTARSYHVLHLPSFSKPKGLKPPHVLIPERRSQQPSRRCSVPPCF
jgi:hypothetical protein